MKPTAVHQIIQRTRARELTSRLVRALSFALPLAAGPAVLLALAFSLSWISADVFLGVGMGLAIAVVGGGVGYAFAGLSTRRIAQLIDRRADLKDRLTNALEFADRAPRTPLMELAIADAESTAPAVRPATLVAVWSPGHTKRLATLLLTIPLLYVLAMINLSDYFKKKTDFRDAVPPLPSELAEDGFRDLPIAGTILPAITGLRGMIGDWRARLTELRERAREQAAAPPKEPELPETIYRESKPAESRAPQVLAADGLPAVRATDRLHASDSRALGAIDPTTVDESMRKAFAQLDETLLDKDPNLAAVQAYVDKLRDASAKNVNAAQATSLQASFGSAKEASQGAFRNKTQAAQSQSFNEFLKQYAEHINRLVEAKQEVNKKRAAEAGGDPSKQGVLTADQGQQLPQDSQLRIVQMSEEMQRGLKLTGEVGQQLNPEGGQGAGQGGGTFRGAFKVKHEDPGTATRQETLKGQLGEGKSSVQILEDADEGKSNLAKLLAAYQADAEERLTDQTIPVAIRAYIQRYLASINPGLDPDKR